MFNKLWRIVVLSWNIVSLIYWQNNTSNQSVIWVNKQYGRYYSDSESNASVNLLRYIIIILCTWTQKNGYLRMIVYSALHQSLPLHAQEQSDPKKIHLTINPFTYLLSLVHVALTTLFWSWTLNSIKYCYDKDWSGLNWNKFHMIICQFSIVSLCCHHHVFHVDFDWSAIAIIFLDILFYNYWWKWTNTKIFGKKHIFLFPSGPFKVIL